MSMSRRPGTRLVRAGAVGAGVLVLLCSVSAASAQRLTVETTAGGPSSTSMGPATARSSAAAWMILPDTAHAAPVRLFEWRFVGEVALGTVGSLALLPLDERIRSWAQDPARQENATLDHTANALIPIGSKGPLIAAAALYGVGLVTGSPTAADIGLHVGEALLGAGTTTLFLKVLAGRKGPSAQGPYAFGRGRLFDVRSRSKAFPSGHSTLAFALAGALTEEASHHWPGTGTWVGAVAFTTATGVAAALVYGDHHWTSDVVAGAVVGTLVSRRVVRSLHTGGAGPFSRIDPILLPGGDGGATVGLALALRPGGS